MRISSRTWLASLIGLFLAGVSITGVYCVAEGCREKVIALHINSYEECVAADYPVVTSDPPRCVVNDELVFVRAPQFIRLNTPKPGEKIFESFTISGEAKALNNTVYYELSRDDEVVLSGGIPANSPEHGRWGDFSDAVSLANIEPGQLSLEVFSEAGTGARIDVITMNLTVVDSSDQLTSSESVVSSNLSAESDTVDSNQFNPLRSIPSEYPTALRLDVPFTPQAPYANWNPPFDEACEEASLLMAYRHRMGEHLTPEDANNRIIEMTAWQDQRGYTIDVTTEELSAIAREYYDVEAAVYVDGDVTVENIKRLIAAGYPVIIPAAGQLLGNPNFRGAGPPYHMLVITGYTESDFVTNDPGTRRGEDYVYSQTVIMNAIADWTGSTDTIESGQKAMMVIR